MLFRSGAGSESNTIDYSQLATPGVNVDLTAGTDTKAGGGGSDTLSAIQNVIGTSGDDVINGDGHANHIWGLAGDDTITAEAGADVIDAGSGTNSVDGGTGPDTISYTTASAGLTISLKNGTATNGSIHDTLQHMENVRGSNFADTITGDSHPNVINGENGNDTINGESGNDTFTARSSMDGSDNVRGGPGVDTVTYAARSGHIHVSLDGVANDGAKGEHDNIHVDVENVITGSGNDTIQGSAASNMLDGGAGVNTLSFANAPSAISVNLTTHVSKHWGTDTVVHFRNVLGSAHSDTITGNSLPNVLSGAGGNDTILGEGGPDTLVGGAGNDHLNGGAGTDHCSGGPGSNVLTSC